MRTQIVATLLGKLLGAYTLFMIVPLVYAVILLHTVLQFFFLYMATFAVSVVLVSATGLTPFDSLGAVAASLGNIGPGFGAVGPASTYSGIHPMAKFVLILDMLLGRLELLTLLVLLHPEFWQPYMPRQSFRFN